jgi:hypothetical protein
MNEPTTTPPREPGRPGPTKAKAKLVTPQKVRAVLRNAELSVARLRISLIEFSSGHLIVWPEHGWDCQRGMVDQTVEAQRCASTLTAAGLTCEVRDGACWVRVEQGQGRPSGEQ